MPINTPSNTIVSAEDPAVYRLVAGQLSTGPSTSLVSGSLEQTNSAESNVTNPTDTGVFTVTRGDISVVDIGAGSGDVTNTGPTNINFATGGNQSVVLASLTTSEINTAVLSNAAVFNTDKNIYITGIDQSVNQQYIPEGGTSYILPVATNSTLGGVKVGSGLSITGDGTLSATGGGGGSGTVTSVGLSMPAGFTVSNSPITTNGTLLVTTSLNGIVAGNGSGFSNINIGSGLSFTSNTLSSTNPGTTYQLNATGAADGANITLAGSDSTIDNVTLESGSNITITNVDANTISISATIPAPQPATTTTLGSVIVGSGLSVDGAGVLTNTNATPYTLPIASAIELGGVKVGGGLAIDGTGILSTTYTLPTASTIQLGGVKVDGTTIVVGAGGVISAIGGGGGGGGIANVTASYPLASSGGITPDISFTGTLDIINGGTNATTAQGARTNLLPSQGASTGSFLQTNGTDVQWQQINSSVITSGLGYTPLNIAGGTMTGTLTLAGNPTQALQAATKSYVDSLATGLQIHLPVRAATTATLVATYNNGVGGDGATLSGSGTLPDIGGVTLAINDRVLIKDQTDSKQNGVYDVTTLGGPTWIITRSSDFDNSAAGEVTAGDTLYVQEGTLNGTQWVMITPGIISIGSSDIVFAQFGGPGTYDAGTGINITGTTISNTGVTSIAGAGNIAVSTSTGATTVSFTGLLPVANGGTGANSFTAGSYLKGNGTSAISVSATVPVADITGTLPVSKGGTGQTSWTPNTLVYASGATTLSSITLGATGTVLTMFNGAPEWRAPTGGGASYSISADTTATSNAVSLALAGSDGSTDLVNFVGGSNVTMTRTDANTITISSTGGGGAAGVSSFSGGSTGLTPATAATGTVTLGGTLNIPSGGTGAQTQQAAINALAGGVTANRVLRGNGTNITLSQVALGTDVTGVLPVANGGIGIAPAAGDANKLLAVNSSGTAYVFSTAGSGTITGVTAGTGLSGGGSSGSVTLNLANTAVSAGSYTNANITVDAQGRITSASNGSGGGSGVSSVGLTMPSGFSVGGSPITSSGTLAVTTSLNGIIAGNGSGFSTVSVGSSLSYSGGTLSLANTAVSAGSYTNANITVDAQGRITSASNGSGGGGGLSTVSAGTGISVVQSGNTATVSVTTATTSVVGGVKVGSGLAITSDGTLSATGGGGGVTQIVAGTNVTISPTGGTGVVTINASGGGAGSSPEIVTFKYASGASANMAADSIQSQTSGVTATVTDPTACTVTFSFSGKSNPPRSIMTYAQVYSTNVFVPRDITNQTSASFSSGGTSDSPNFVTGFSSSNVLTLTLTMNNTGAAGASLKRAWLMVVFGF